MLSHLFRFSNVYWSKCEQTEYLTGEAISGKMGRVYVTYVANVDKRQ